MNRFRFAAVVVLSLSISATTATAQIDPDLLGGIKARSIGPAAMSGRVVAIDAVEANPETIYVGAATGGVWKSTNGGTTFAPVFDDQPVAAVGAITINQRSPEIVWVGTGEPSVRNSASVGNGVYRTLDGGKSWQHLGLEKSERISKIILHPSDPNTAWVAAMGQAWGENAERGVFKTTDGGKTWQKVLYVSPSSGAADLIVDPNNPNKLFAAMWDYRRWPWFFRSGGAGSGLHVTVDGGTTWRRYTEDDGMPKGELGRIGLAISRSNPEVVYALVEAQASALIRSDDGGRTWRRVNEQPDVAPRPFYFSSIVVDPQNPNRLFNLWTFLSLSEDGGRSFSTLPAAIHPDHHTLWIDPKNPKYILNGNDGGVAISHDGGSAWTFVDTLPLAQFYHIAYDMEQPYNIYGGLQDNGSWRGPSAVWERGPIRDHHWQEVDFGDGFATTAISDDATTGYAMAQTGYLVRWDLKTGVRKDIRPPDPDNAKLRFNWNAAIALDPFEPNTLYYGSQFVHKSTNRGESWTTISGDLTTNNRQWQQQHRTGGLTLDVSGAENFTTILSIAPSRKQQGVIWTATDDGRIHVTRDAGATWSSVEASIAGVPKNSWIPHIEASRFDAGTAFVVFDNHRRSDWTPYVYRTTDFGKSWTSLATKDLRGYALTIVQDPVDADLLFLGTEFGLYVTMDGGKSWTRWKHGLPTVSTMALAIHPRDNDLIIGTHGRAAYIVDDITPLREITPALLKEPLHLFAAPDVLQYWPAQPAGARFLGNGHFGGENAARGAVITFSLNAPGLPFHDTDRERARKQQERDAARTAPTITAEGVPQEMIDEGKATPNASASTVTVKPADDKGPQVDIEVLDSTGKLIRTFKAPARLGVNRVTWDLAMKAPKQFPRERTPDDGEPTGQSVLPGIYQVRVKYGEAQATQSVRITPDPRMQISDADRQAKLTALQRVDVLQEAVATAIERILQTRTDMDATLAKVKAAAGPDAESKQPTELEKAATILRDQLTAMEKRLWIPPKTRGIQPDDDAASKIETLQYLLGSSWDAPTESQQISLRQTEALTRKSIEETNRLFANDVAKFRQLVRAANVQLLPEEKPIELK